MIKPITGLKIKYLDVYGTLTDDRDLKSLVKFLHKTDLKDSLEKIHILIHPSKFKELKEDLTAIGYANTKIVLDNYIPVSRSTVMENHKYP
mmetsp:Transcript_1388/g.1229  ORF Transcript_1388/g.1229 Transcript_1388/m.1229 type:complete len:91 (+) Transcript_1388:680-952(+)